MPMSGLLGLPLRAAAGYRTWSKSNAACGEYVTVLKVTDAATDALQTARAGKNINCESGFGFCQLDDAFAATQRSLA